MSKLFLTKNQAYSKLGISGGNNDWIRKSELLATGKCNEVLLAKYEDNDFVLDDDIAFGRIPRLVFNNSFLTENLQTNGWKIENTNANLDINNGLILDNTFLQYSNNSGFTWYDFEEIVMDFDCMQRYLNTSTIKRIVSLTNNGIPDGTGFLYQQNNSCAIVLNNNTPITGWVSIYTSEYDWGTFDSWYHVHIIMKPDFMSLQLNDFTKTFSRPSYDRFRKFNSIYFGALNNGLDQKCKGYIKNFSLMAY